MIDVRLRISTSVVLVLLPVVLSFPTQPTFVLYPASSLIPHPPQSSLKRTKPTLAPASREFRRSALAAIDDEAPPSSLTNNLDDDDDNEWDYEEYEDLAEADFYNSEWKVGTVMDGDPENPNKKEEIIETWCRLLVEEVDQGIGKRQVQRCIWGDGERGKWNFDRASQFLSLTKDSYGGWLGKKIWAGTVTDFYYLQGSVRGWSPISPASVVGQWQAKRLGVDKGEAGTAPWFQVDEEEVDDGEKEDARLFETPMVVDEAQMLADSIQENATVENEPDNSVPSLEDEGEDEDKQEEIETPWFADAKDSTSESDNVTE